MYRTKGIVGIDGKNETENENENENYFVGEGDIGGEPGQEFTRGDGLKDIDLAQEQGQEV